MADQVGSVLSRHAAVLQPHQRPVRHAKRKPSPRRRERGKSRVLPNA